MRTLALAALLLATACGRPLLYAEVEVPSAVVTVPRQSFSAITTGDLCTAPGSDPANRCSQTLISYDLGSDFRDLMKDARTLDLRLIQLAIHLNAADPVTNPLSNFDGVRRLRILAEGRDASTPTLELARYERSTGTTGLGEIAVSTREAVNLGPYVQAGFIGLRAELEVDPVGLPLFTADVTGDFYLLVTIDWGKASGIL